MLVPWDELNNLGIPVIDEQHRQLYAMLNELNRAMAEGRGKIIAAGIMNRLVPLIREHFGAEEKFCSSSMLPTIADAASNTRNSFPCCKCF